MFVSKYHEQLLELNLHHLTLVFLLINWKLVFKKIQQLQSFIWLRYIDDILFIWTDVVNQLELFLEDLNEFNQT